MNQTKGLIDTYLVQQLREPYKNQHNLGELFSFGCGYKNGGLSDNAMSLLKTIFSFNYMGAAEYEFGALPASLKEMAANIKKYSTWIHAINHTPVYVLAPIDSKEEINIRLDEIASNKPYIKCGCDLDVAVGKSKWTKKENCKTIGYLELDNHFAFFVQKHPWEQFCKLFGVETI